MRSVNTSDDELALRAARGEAEAFDALVVRHSPVVYRIVRRLCSDAAEAEAITQEAFLRAWEGMGRFRTGQPFRPWLVQIAVNAARDAIKKARPLDFADLPEDETLGVAADEPGPEERMEESEALAQLATAVQALPAAYRMIIALRYDAEMSYEDIARTLKLPLNTVRTRLHRAKARLRERLEAAHERPPG
jgi:RNA polymerase sigma-70 factor (ECF subfamily)